MVKQKHLFAITPNSSEFLSGKQVLRFFNTILRRDPKHAYINGLTIQAIPAIIGSGKYERLLNSKNPSRVKTCPDPIDLGCLGFLFAGTRCELIYVNEVQLYISSKVEQKHLWSFRNFSPAKIND
jgi:hypothetical protein